MTHSMEALRNIIIQQNHEIEQILGKALGYPPLYPEASHVDDGQVCVGTHVAESLADEAAERIRKLTEEVRRLKEENPLEAEVVRLKAERDQAWKNTKVCDGAIVCGFGLDAIEVLAQRTTKAQKRADKAEAETQKVAESLRERARWMHNRHVRDVFHDQHNFNFETCNSAWCARARRDLYEVQNPIRMLTELLKESGATVCVCTQCAHQSAYGPCNSCHCGNRRAAAQGAKP